MLGSLTGLKRRCHPAVYLTSLIVSSSWDSARDVQGVLAVQISVRDWDWNAALPS